MSRFGNAVRTFVHINPEDSASSYMVAIFNSFSVIEILFDQLSGERTYEASFYTVRKNRMYNIY